MKLKKFGALLLTGVLAITSLTTSAFAAKREKRSADDIDFAAVLEDTSAKGTVNVYHWWTAGGEKDAIESVIDEFKGAYGKVKTKSNAIPGGAGGAMVQQQVLQASGIRQGGNLFLLNKHQAAASITEQLPYVESVRIRRQLPNALHIEITECAHPLALEQDGAVWLLNGSGKLIDKLQPGQGESYPLVTGLALTSPQLNRLAVPDNADKWDTLRQLWQQLLSKDMAGSVQSIDLEDPSRITLRYLDRFDVVLKKDDDFDYRLNYLAAVIGRLDGSDQGTIQWDKDGKARFIPG